MAEPDFPGLKWIPKTFSLEPAWTIEPDLEAAKQVIESRLTRSSVTISFLAQGASNKLYTVDGDGDAETLVLRITLPVDPRYKTLSEVATMDWMLRNTTIPVPVVVAYEASRDDPVGFEWILMTKLPGKPLADTWRSLPYLAKEGLARRFAEYSSCLFKRQLSCIGNIYTVSPPKVDRIVSMPFFWGDHIHQDVRRGPFSSSRDWIEARLALSEHDCHSAIAKYIPSKAVLTATAKMSWMTRNERLRSSRGCRPLSARYSLPASRATSPRCSSTTTFLSITYLSTTAAPLPGWWTGSASRPCRSGRRATTHRSWKVQGETTTPTGLDTSAKVTASLWTSTGST